MVSGKTRQTVLILGLSFFWAGVGLGGTNGKAIITSINGLFHGEAAMGPDPVHPTMEKFTLRDASGRVLWAKDSFGQNACWISGDGRAVVGLRCAGVEGLAGELTFFGLDGQRLSGMRVTNFSGGGFTEEGSLFICRTGDLGIAAFDARGKELWAVASGSQYSCSRDGRWLAVVRKDTLYMYSNGTAWSEMPLDAPYLEKMAFGPGGESFACRTAFAEIEYDLLTRRVTASRPAVPRQLPARVPAGPRSPVGWPIGPTNAAHPLGNGWGEYQWYGGDPYLHPGVDVMALTDTGVAVYAVAHGWVKAWLTTSGTWHWRLAIADSGLGFSDSCDGWLYAHIDANRPHLAVGDEVWPGDWIGYLVPWPVAGFDHLHFARISDAGSVWGNAGADWVFQDSPLNHLSPVGDTTVPVIEPALASSKFAYCRDNASLYLPAGNLTGDVDIVARIHDRFGLPIPAYPEWEKLNPCRVEYAVHGPGDSVPRIASFLFSHFLPYSDLGVVSAVFKQDDSCVTYGDYDDRQYYYIVTNTDGDTTLEAADAAGCWRTTELPDGHYWVVIYAADQSGNATADSQLVTVNNYGGVAGRPEALGPKALLGLEASPNPFGTRARIWVTVGEPGRLDLSVFNPLGEKVATLDGGWRSAGRHLVTWDGRNGDGKPAPAGAYIVKAGSGRTTAIARLIRLR